MMLRWTGCHEDYDQFRELSSAENTPLAKLGTAGAGGMPVIKAAGFVTMCAGVKHQCSNDDTLLNSADTLLRHFYAADVPAAARGGVRSARGVFRRGHSRRFPPPCGGRVG